MTVENQTVYSWSRLNSFHLASIGEGCYHSFDQSYNVGDRGDQNYFAEYGLLFHETVEKLLRKELFEWDIEDELKRGLANFVYRPPFPRMGQSYVDAIMNFFNSDFDSLFSKYKILETEEEQTFKVEDIAIRGFPDLVGEHDTYGFVIGDYKTSKVYTGDKLHHNIQQLYLYSIPIAEKYGRYPSHLVYIFPREKGQKEYAYPLNMDDLERTKKWAVETAKKIEQHEDWKPRCLSVDGSKDFYANNICNHRKTCEHKNAIRNPFGEE